MCVFGAIFIFKGLFEAAAQWFIMGYTYHLGSEVKNGTQGNINFIELNV